MKIYHLSYKEKNISCYITYKNVKNINLRINSDQIVKISAPKGIKFEIIKEFIDSKKNWIINKINKFEEMIRIHPKQFENGSELYYLGNKYTLNIKKGEKYVKIACKSRNIFISNMNEKNIEKIFYNWQKNQSQIIFEKILDELYPCVQIYGVQYPKLKVKKMYSRWGSCSYSRGNININQLLVALPTNVIRYVILHELAHFIEPNHSKEFYELIEKFMPNYNKHRKYLRTIKLK